MLGSPFPLLCGLNCDYEKVREEIIPEFSDSSVSAIYVFLDNQYILTSRGAVETTVIPDAEELISSIEGKFSSLFSDRRSISVSIDKTEGRFHAKHKILRPKQAAKESSFGKQQLNPPKDSEVGDYKEFLSLVRKFITDGFIKDLPDVNENVRLSLIMRIKSQSMN